MSETKPSTDFPVVAMSYQPPISEDDDNENKRKEVTPKTGNNRNDSNCTASAMAGVQSLPVFQKN